MSRVRALVEGVTEETFVRVVLGPHLGSQGVSISATMVGRPGRRGGVRAWPVVRRDVLAALKQDEAIYCTTMFDYYGLPCDWPGIERAKRARLHLERAEAVERAIAVDVCQEFGESFNPQRFIPYIQMHEFEALLFSDTLELATAVGHPGMETGLARIVADYGEPEKIDDNPETAPSKRLGALLPRYQKVLHGIIAAKRIGLATMRQQCPHFSGWLDGLEGLGQEHA